jgi:MFS family permease
LSSHHLRWCIDMPHDSEMPNSTDKQGDPVAVARSTLVAACVSGFLFQFDLTALSAALPDIASSLSARVADQAWIIHVYSLALIFALPLAGPLADRFGRRRLFMSGTVVFALASVMCAIATTLVSLLAWRVLQGVAGAALTAASAALLAAAYPGSRRAWAFGLYGTVVGASMVAGPPLGALIATAFGWPWVFWINLPICLGLLLLTRRTASDQAPSKSYASLDWAGPAALAVGVGSLAFLMLAGHAIGGSDDRNLDSDWRVYRCFGAFHPHREATRCSRVRFCAVWFFAICCDVSCSHRSLHWILGPTGSLAANGEGAYGT